MAFFQFLQPLCLLFLLLHAFPLPSVIGMSDIFSIRPETHEKIYYFLSCQRNGMIDEIYISTFFFWVKDIFFFILLFSLLLLNSNFGSICVKWPSFNNSLNWLLMKNSKSEIEIFYFSRSTSFLLFFSYTYIRKRFAYVNFFLGIEFFPFGNHSFCRVSFIGILKEFGEREESP